MPALVSPGGSGGAVPAPTPATPAAAPAVAAGSSPIPLTSGDYASAAAMANTAYQQALAQVNSQRQSALQQYGYTGTINPTTGTLTDMRVDPNNPYGQYQEMLQTHALDQQGVQASDAARGIGAASGARGGGLAAQGITQDKLAFGADSANLGEGLMGTLGDLQGQQTSAQDTMNNALWQAELSSAQNAILNQAFDPANLSGVTDQPVKGGAVPKAVTTIQPASAKGAVGGKIPNPNASKGVKIKAARTRAARQRVDAHRHTAAHKTRKGRR
jgi:hypothetical protein